MNKKQETLIIVGVHGNEHAPIKAVKRLAKARGINYLVANPEAIRKNARFLDTDLNRCFPGNPDGSREEKIAVRICSQMQEYGSAIDLHTATCQTPPFIIFTGLSAQHRALINRLDVSRVVYMEKSIASGRALIDHVKVGVSVECGFDRSKATEEIIRLFLEKYLSNRTVQREKQYFSVFEIIKKIGAREKLDKGIKSFKLVKKGDVISRNETSVRSARFSFYPVLARERSYKGVLCLAARSVSAEELFFGSFQIRRGAKHG